MVLSNEDDIKECMTLLRKGVMFRYCSDEVLRKVAKNMEKRRYKKGDELIKQDDPSNVMFVLAEGTIVRLRTIDGVQHQIDTKVCGNTVGSLHLLRQDPCHATAQCTGPVVTYSLSSPQLNELIRTDPDIAESILYSLTKEVRNQTKLMRTPLLEQHPKQTPFLANSIAAGIESFYRSALNAALNARLTGDTPKSYFPNMHVQVPTRIVYINGFKGIRQILDEKLHPENYSNPTLVRLGAAVTPGIIMTPFSSILEACNAGHRNPEPLHFRATRGLFPRGGREVIFGIGLNQLSDWCEERVPIVQNATLRNALGSMMAGVISGYISHVPHNLSTMKLMDPKTSYSQHFRNFCSQWSSKLEPLIPKPALPAVSTLLTVLLPKGVTIRTTQIVGSFIILNGTINALSAKKL